MLQLNFRRIAVLSLLAFSVFAAPKSSNAIILPIDVYLEGDVSIIPFLPAGTIEITDVGVDTVQFDLTPIAGVKFDNLGLGLGNGISDTDLVLTPLTPDQMTLALGGWLGFPFQITFNDKPMTPVSFRFSAPGLDVSDFLVLPASHIYPTTNFALRFWFMVPGRIINDPIDITAGNDPGSGIPEPTSLLLLGTGILALAGARKSRA